MTWQIVQTVAIPSSATAGPRRVVDGIPSGFAHTPTGALMLVGQMQGRLFQRNVTAVLGTDSEPTPGRASMLGHLAALDVPWTPAQPGSLLQLAGFQFVSYTPATAVIQVLNGPDPSGDYNVSTLSVAWSGSDWQLVVAPGGLVSPTVQTVTSPIGFVPWAGV